jgi:uncharacterized membrane protein
MHLKMIKWNTMDAQTSGFGLSVILVSVGWLIPASHRMSESRARGRSCVRIFVLSMFSATEPMSSQGVSRHI